MARVNGCIGEDNSQSMCLLRRLIDDTAVSLLADTNKTAEDRRILWTTFANIKMWFDNWERDLIELGFASVDSDGKTFIPKEQLSNIVNVDETCLSLDSSMACEGGGLRQPSSIQGSLVLAKAQAKVRRPRR